MAEAIQGSTIGMIAGVLLFSVIGLASLNAYAATQQAEERFDEFISTINNLEDGQQDSLLLSLPEDSILVSFDDGKDFDSCGEEITNPIECGEYPCICVCSTSWLASNEDACAKKSQYCETFTTTDITQFSSIECDGGLYKEGTSGGVQNIYFKKTGSTITFCNTEDCFSNETIKEEPKEDTSKLFV